MGVAPVFLISRRFSPVSQSSTVNPVLCCDTPPGLFASSFPGPPIHPTKKKELTSKSIVIPVLFLILTPPILLFGIQR